MDADNTSTLSSAVGGEVRRKEIAHNLSNSLRETMAKLRETETAPVIFTKAHAKIIRSVLPSVIGSMASRVLVLEKALEISSAHISSLQSRITALEAKRGRRGGHGGAS